MAARIVSQNTNRLANRLAIKGKAAYCSL